MFHFGFTEIVQKRPPASRIFQVLRDVFRKQNVTGIAAIHHSLRHVDARARDIGPPVHIDHFAHRSAVNSHPHLNRGCSLALATHLQRALRRFLRAIPKDECHSITSR